MADNIPVFPEHVYVLLQRRIDDHPEFDNRPELIEVINGGQSQIVFLNHHRHGPVAVKVINTTDAYGRAIENLTAEQRQILRANRPKWTARELLHLLLVQGHPGVIEVHDAFFSGPEYHRHKYFFIVMEKGDWDLETFVQNHYPQGASEDEVRPIMQQIVCSLHYLHFRGVVHRDIKAANYLLFRSQSSLYYTLNNERQTRFAIDDIVKIADFGFAKSRINSIHRSKVGTLHYAAPEILNNQLQGSYDGYKVDIWSLGVLFHFLLCRLCPFGPFQEDYTNSNMLTHSSMFSRIMESEPYLLTNETQNLSPECTDLLTKMLKKNPDERIGILEVKNHPWIQLGYNRSTADGLDRSVNRVDRRANRVEDPEFYEYFENGIKEKVAHNIEFAEMDVEVPQHLVDSIWDMIL